MTLHGLANRYRCSGDISTLCDKGSGVPPRRKCRHCGSTLYTERGRWGVFIWRGDGRYPEGNAVRIFRVEKAADAYALCDTSYVVRWIPA